MKSNWEQIKLADLFELQMGKTPAREKDQYWKNGNNKWISIADISKFSRYTEETKEKITDIAISESGIKQVPANTLIMSFKLSLGKVAITSEPIYTNEAIMAFIDLKKRQFSLAFLFHLFKNKDWSAGTNKAVLGMTLNKATLKDISIPVPPLPEQEDIAQKLDTVCRLITLREQQLQKLDQLASSRFIEMFGDPVTNPKRWQVLPLDVLGELNRGVSKARPRNTPDLLGGIYPLVQTGEVSNSDSYITKFEQTYSEKGLAQSRMWQAGTLCITIAANIAQTAILTFDACFPDSVVGFIANKQTKQLFIHYWFKFFQKILEDQAPQVAQKNINLKILKELQVIVPPKSLQQEFCQFIEQLDKSKVIGEKQGIMLEKITCHDIL